jgi:uncharacterized protein
VRAALASPFGFLIGLSLGALGGGGSILAVPVLVFVAGLSPVQATSTSLVVVGTASLIGAYGHWRAGRVRVGAGLAFGLVGVGGSLAGSALSERLDDGVLLLLFSGLILVAAWRIVVGCPSCTRAGEAAALDARRRAGRPSEASGGVALRTRRWSAVALAEVVAVGTAVGFLTGLFGVGGGFIIVPALTLVLHFTMAEAIGTSLLVIAVNTAVALLARVDAGAIDWTTTLVFTAAAVAGVVTGNRVAGRVDPRHLQRGFAILLVGVAALTATTAVASLR